MGCNEFTCGTGLGEVVLPGDPTNNSVLYVTPVYGGNRLSWSYPTTNPHAVALINIFRGVNTNFYSATPLDSVSATFYLDEIEEDEIREYFYWIQLVSVNGTIFEVIGPEASIPLSAIGKTMEALTEKIDSGLLSTSLRAKIDRITGLAADLDAETEARTLRDTVVAEAMAAIQADTSRALNYIAEEVVSRESATEALLSTVNILASGLEDAQAALVTEQTTRVNQDSALASQITQAETTLAGQVAAVQVTLGTEIDAINGHVQNIGALWTARMTVNNLIGGFGIYNDGTSVEAGFDVDSFWIGRTNENKVKPFIIYNGITYIDDARIRKITFNKLQDESENFVVENGKLKAEYLNVKELSVGAFAGWQWPTAGQGGGYFGNNGLLLGNYNGGGHYLQIASGYGTGGNASISTNIPAFIKTLNVAAGAITYSNFLEQSGKWYLGENSKTTVLSMNIDCGDAMGGIVELDWAVGMGTDQISKRYWAVTVRVYRDSTILREMNSSVINLASKSQQVPEYVESTDENGNAIMIESGNYVYPTSLSRFKLTDYYAPAGVHTYSIWVWVRKGNGTPYTWINERSMWTKFTKR